MNALKRRLSPILLLLVLLLVGVAVYFYAWIPLDKALAEARGEAERAEKELAHAQKVSEQREEMAGELEEVKKSMVEMETMILPTPHEPEFLIYLEDLAAEHSVDLRRIAYAEPEAGEDSQLCHAAVRIGFIARFENILGLVEDLESGPWFLRYVSFSVSRRETQEDEEEGEEGSEVHIQPEVEGEFAFRLYYWPALEKLQNPNLPSFAPAGRPDPFYPR